MIGDHPTRVARCGGPSLCALCKKESEEFQAKHTEWIKNVSDSPVDQARQHVVDYFNARAEKTDSFTITLEDVYVVWFCYTLGNWKALVSTTVNDNMYYEVTHKPEHDGSDGPAATYLDAYRKWENIKIDA